MLVVKQFGSFVGKWDRPLFDGGDEMDLVVRIRDARGKRDMVVNVNLNPKLLEQYTQEVIEAKILERIEFPPEEEGEDFEILGVGVYDESQISCATN